MDADEMAKHISLNAPKTDFEKESKALRKNMDPNAMTDFWMDRIDSMDPELGQDLTEEFMDVQKTQGQIKRLEAKIESERGDYSKFDEINADEMLLKNYKQ